MKRLLLIALLTLLAFSGLHAQSQFALGNLVVYRVGDGVAGLSNASTAIFLDEYTIGGVKVQSVALPTSGASVITASGTATSEGVLTRSVDGRYLVLCGYGYPPGLAKINGTGDSVLRCIARIDYKAATDVTTRLGDAYDANNIRAAITTDGSGFWIAGPSGATGGVRYAKFGTTTSKRLVNINTRAVGIYKSQLYASASSSPYYGVFPVGTGLPIDTGQIATLPTYSPATSGMSMYGFAISPNGNTMYMAADTSSGIPGVLKWTLSGSTWTYAYVLSSGLSLAGIRSLTVDWSGTNPVIYGTDAITGNVTHLVKVTDAGSSSAFTTLATSPANTAFRGIAFAPSATATGVAEQQVVPVSFGLLQNYPNPFNPSTTLRYSIVEPGTVTLKIFNMLGEAVATIVNEHKNIGTFNAVWDASHQPSGVYVARLASVSDSKQMSTESRRLMLVK
jgi:hypothetical protein